jgi:hypothetical protein
MAKNMKSANKGHHLPITYSMQNQWQRNGDKPLSTVTIHTMHNVQVHIMTAV